MLPQTQNPAGASARQTSAVGHHRWMICALLFFATTVIYIDRQILSLIKPILDQQLGWTNEQFGLVNAAFQGAYGVSLLVFGWFVDRFGTKIGYAVTIGAWAIAACGHALVSSISGFVAARLTLGLGEGGNFPSAIKATALWFPKQERALATTIFNSGANVGAIIAPAIVPAIAYNWGWHWAYIIAGVLGFIWLAFWLPYYNVPEKAKKLSAAEFAYIESDNDTNNGGEAPKVSWWYLLTLRQTWAFIVAKFMTDPVWWFFLIWLPDYFHKTRGLEFKPAPGASFAIPLPLVAIYTIVTVLSIGGGWLTGYLKRSGWSVTRARKAGMALFAVLVIPILTLSIYKDASDWTAISLIALAGAAHQAWSATIFTTVSDVFPKYAVGSVIGIGGLAGGIGGMLFPILCGKVLDSFGAQKGYGILFCVCAFAYVVTFAVHHLLAPKLDPIEVKHT